MFDALYQFHSLLMVSWAEKRPVEGGISHAIVRIYHLEYSHLKMIALINCLPSRNSTKPFTGSTPALFTYHCHCWKEEKKWLRLIPSQFHQPTSQVRRGTCLVDPHLGIGALPSSFAVLPSANCLRDDHHHYYDDWLQGMLWPPFSNCLLFHPDRPHPGLGFVQRSPKFLLPQFPVGAVLLWRSFDVFYLKCVRTALALERNEFQ